MSESRGLPRTAMGCHRLPAAIRSQGRSIRSQEPGEAPPSEPLDYRREYISIILSHPPVLLCYSSSQKLTHHSSCWSLCWHSPHLSHRKLQSQNSAWLTGVPSLTFCSNIILSGRSLLPYLNQSHGYSSLPVFYFFHGTYHILIYSTMFLCIMLIAC